MEMKMKWEINRLTEVHDGDLVTAYVGVVHKFGDPQE